MTTIEHPVPETIWPVLDPDTLAFLETMDAVDTFAGPGGWDVAASALGLDVLGIEWDETACQTRAAAGHRTVRADVSVLDPAAFSARPRRGRRRGQLGSPPCQGFSMAGKGRGRADSAALLARLESVETLDDLLAAIDDLRDVMSDEKTLLALEPLRWALTNLPDWIAWEQVPPVLPLWVACGRILRLHGYSVDEGVLTAEMFGVPQTRKRAILVGRSARLTAEIGPVALPTPTHSKFYSRNPAKLDPGVEKWVSMAEALGWGATERPAMTVTGGGATTGGAEPFGNGARKSLERERDAGRWQDAEVTVCTGQNSRINGAGETRLFSRDVNAPSPTVTGQARSWRIEDHRPTPAIDGETITDLYWVYDRPSPTIVGSFAPDVVAKPGYRKAGDPPRQKTPGSVRITIAEAARLQSFPDNYQWQGKSGKVFLQIGNAIPPLLALHVICAATGIEVPA